jgi:hypothetical protein
MPPETSRFSTVVQPGSSLSGWRSTPRKARTSWPDQPQTSQYPPVPSTHVRPPHWTPCTNRRWIWPSSYVFAFFRTSRSTLAGSLSSLVLCLQMRSIAKYLDYFSILLHRYITGCMLKEPTKTYISKSSFKSIIRGLFIFPLQLEVAETLLYPSKHCQSCGKVQFLLLRLLQRPLELFL